MAEVDMLKKIQETQFDDLLYPGGSSSSGIFSSNKEKEDVPNGKYESPAKNFKEIEKTNNKNPNPNPNLSSNSNENSKKISKQPLNIKK